MAPDVTVVIPTRNRAQLLTRAISCALAQRQVAVEVIAVDDGSRDDTPSVLARIRDTRVRTLRHESSRGVARSRNDGIEAARGEWIAFLDDDDIWAPTKLREQLDRAAATGAAFVYAAAARITDSGRLLEIEPAAPPDELARALVLRNAIPGGCSGVIATASLVRAVGGFDESLSVVADWDFWIRLVQDAPGAEVNRVLFAYFRHGASMVPASGRAALEEFEILARKHVAFARDHHAAFDRHRFLRYLARECRSYGSRTHAARLYVAAAIAHHSASDLTRAVAALGGEPFARVVRRLRKRSAAAEQPIPAWLTPFVACG